MGLQTTILNSVAKAFEITDDLMSDYTFSSVTSVYDPATSVTTKNEVTELVKGFIDTDSESYEDKGAISTYDIVVYLKGMTASPNMGDKITIGVFPYTIVHAVDIHVGDALALHRVWLKK